MTHTNSPEKAKRFARRWPVLGAIALAAVVALPTAGAPSDDDKAVDLVQTRSTIEQWVETRGLISKERAKWELQKEVMRDRIDTLEREIEKRKKAIEDARASIAETDAKRTELAEKLAKLTEATDGMDSSVLELEQRTQKLLPRIPKVIRERVEPFRQKFPENPSDTDLSLSQRFMNVIGVLNGVNKFNGTIEVTKEVRTLPDGNAAEVSAMYLGIAMGYYVGVNGEVGGIGSPTADGWVWTPANDSAKAIQRAIQIRMGEKNPAYVQLPIRIE